MITCIFTGGGAFCNGQKIHVSQTEEVNDDCSFWMSSMAYMWSDSFASFYLRLFPSHPAKLKEYLRSFTSALWQSLVAWSLIAAYEFLAILFSLQGVILD